MIISGEHLFQSFDEAFEFFNQPTHYERQKGITIVRDKIYDCSPDLRLLQRFTSDGRSTAVIFFRNSSRHDIWKFWIPSEDQMLLLRHVVPAFIMRVEKTNGEVKSNENR